MKRDLVSCNDVQLEYITYGDGKEHVLCMHGHGRQAEDFKFVAKEDRKVISINLFHHGNSIFPLERIEKNPITTSEVIQLMQLIIKKENLINFHCIAFSQGGRFILALLPHFQKQILSISLLSPDGLDNYSFYNWASRRKWARKLFISWEKEPNKLRKFSDVAVRLMLMRPKVRDFVYKFTNDHKTLQRASQSWRSFRLIMSKPKQTGLIILENNIPFVIIMGKYDKIIRPIQALRYAKKSGLINCVIQIECGHDFFKKENIDLFKPNLLIQID